MAFVVTHHGDPSRQYIGSGGKYRELVLEGKDGVYPKRAERGQFPEVFPQNVHLTKRQTKAANLADYLVIPCPSRFPSNTRASLYVFVGFG